MYSGTFELEGAQVIPEFSGMVPTQGLTTKVPPGQLLKHTECHTHQDCQGCGESGTLRQCWWECKTLQLLEKTV